MDKLKPILAHKFWIILFIALLLPVIGWSMATGGLAKEIEERKTAIDKAFTDAQISPNPPNETWSTALKQINKEKENYIGQSHKYLWDKQKSLFVWPTNIAPLMKDTPYRGEISRVPRNLYRSAYKFEILRVHKLANPFDLREGTGTVDLSPNVIPHVPLDKWKTLPPTPKEMWDAQEDIWLVTSILKAIADVNKGAANISESAVRQISVLELRGGTVGDDGSAPAGGDGMDPGMSMEGDFAGGGGLFGGGGPQPGMAGGKDGMQSISVDMDLKEIFGNDVDGSAGGGDESGEMMESADAMVPGGLGGGFGARGAQNLKRYYHEEEELPYKTRAFYLKVVVQSTKLPHLLAELTKMPWPVEIKRVQIADMFDDNLSPLGQMGGGMAGRRPGRGGAMAGGDEFDLESSLDGGLGRPGAGFEADGLPGAGRDQGLENKSLLDAALNDPELAVVTIAGLMTLYKPYTPPEGDVVAQSEGGEMDANQQPVTGAEPQPADSSTTPPVENPANPVELTAPAENSEKQPDDSTTGEQPKQPTESTQPQPAGSDSNNPQLPKTEPKSEEAVK
ncbi:hypothetical protein [Gimesia aquarii]|uniref:Uncharacterized protein n=1 Tax=Gimesia aquarii TaxID=2527964 RepID=A0A517X1E9_9PLAN|nr:hypothetical protein [Gimesia aquarii]QDU11322.1 hypothetical protein V202x_47420 [Gimesia aquarii]